MTILEGLQEIDNDIKESSDSNKTRYLDLEDKATVFIRFLDDLDKNTPMVDLGAGVAVVMREHKSPKNFRRRALCTKKTRNSYVSGECYACDQAVESPRTGWGMTRRAYLNVLVDDGLNDPYVAVWSLGIAKNTTWEQLIEEFHDSGTIADSPWRVRRSGTGTNTTFVIKKMDGDHAAFNDYDRFDLKSVTKSVPFEEQASYYEVAPSDPTSDFRQTEDTDSMFLAEWK